MLRVSLIGKPNVGKSSIFNRLIRENKSIVMDTPGITRDRIYGKVTYKNKEFELIDTGGIEFGNEDFAKDIKLQATIAIEESDIILFIIDGNSELDKNDYQIRNLLMKSNKDVIVIANKIDNDKRRNNIYNYYELGFETIIPFSAEHNIGTFDLLDLLIKNITNEKVEENEDILKFCIIGRPNTGKSSLVNALINKEQLIVSNVAGTTRDAVDTKFRYNNEEYIVIDTAGMRKKGKIYENIEKYSLIRSTRAIERSNVCVVVINAEEGIIEHDKHIIGYALEAGKAIVLVINKWDLITNKGEERKNWDLLIENDMKFISFVKTVYLSSKTKKGIDALMPEIINAYENSKREVNIGRLNEVIQNAYLMHPAPSYKGRRLKINKVIESAIKPPKFTFLVNDKGLVHFSYQRYLENCLRKEFDFTGTPIEMQFKNKDDE